MDWTENLKKLMKDAGVNNLELQERIRGAGGRLSRNSIGDILNGKHSPRVEALQLIANALGVELRQIFTVPGEELTGFIEYKGQVYRVGSLSELENLVYHLKKNI